MSDRFTLPVGRDPTDDEVEAVINLLDGLEWFSDYDAGISICTPAETLRAGPGQTVIRNPDGSVTIEGEEVRS